MLGNIQVNAREGKLGVSGKYPETGFIQAILMSGRRYKKLNLLIEFSNSTS